MPIRSCYRTIYMEYILSTDLKKVLADAKVPKNMPM